MRPLIYSLFLLFIVNFSAFGAVSMVELDKVIEKSYPIEADGTFDVTNRYGNVDITTWDKQQIDIKITISVKTSNQKKADEIFDRIDFKFMDRKDYVTAITEIESKNNSWFNWGSWSSTDYQINYDVKMPASVHLKCTNKYGNTYLDDLNNGAELVMKYGNIRMGSVEGEMTLDLGYGKIEFGDVGDLDAIIKYSGIKGSSTQDMKIDSKYSNIKLGDVKELKADTKYDSYVIEKIGRIDNIGKYDGWSIGEVDDVLIDSKYTGIKIERLLGDLSLDQKFGSLSVQELTCADSSIEVEVEYTDVNIKTEGCGDIEIDYSGEYTSVNFSGDLDDRLEQDGKRTWLKDRFGSGALKMRFDMRYGSLKLR